MIDEGLYIRTEFDPSEYIRFGRHTDGSCLILTHSKESRTSAFLILTPEEARRVATYLLKEFPECSSPSPSSLQMLDTPSISLAETIAKPFER